MYRRDEIEKERHNRGTIMTTTAMGRVQVVDVDEWLYQASRVRAFTPTDYVPRHRAAS
jgi:hypothetical protein